MQLEYSVTCTEKVALTEAVCAGGVNAAAQVATAKRRRCEFMVILKTHAEDMADVSNPESGL